MNDDEAHYKTTFEKLDPKKELELGSSPPTPKIWQDQNEEQYTNQPVRSNDR